MLDNSNSQEIIEVEPSPKPSIPKKDAPLWGFETELIVVGQVVVTSTALFFWRKIKPFFEKQQRRLLNSNSERISRTLEEIGYVTDADRVIACEFVPNGQNTKIICNYEITRHGANNVAHRINERACSRSAIETLKKRPFIKRKTSEIEQDSYRALLQSLEVKYVIIAALELDDQIYGFISIQYNHEKPSFNTVEREDITHLVDKISYKVTQKD